VSDDSDDLEEAVDRFLAAADDALHEYDQGYADADATLRRLRADVETLREASED
jgi:ribosomal 50S subunit-associated protein YjgA (DUF615 family)